MDTRTIIIAEHHNGHILPLTYELITFAKQLTDREPEIIIIGKDIFSLSKELSEYTGLSVTGIEGDHLEQYHLESYKSAILGIINNRDPLYICLAHTSLGSDLGPCLSVPLQAACITSIQGLYDSIFTRAIFGGKILTDSTLKTASAVFTILPGAFSGQLTKEHPNGKVEIIYDSHLPESSKPLGIKDSNLKNISFADAEVIVSGGKGIGSPQNISLLKELASIFKKSAIGASRIACDLGGMDHSFQIGITGQTVAPYLYIACGISGAIQHISGMKDSHLIIAINKDPHASIFQVADYCIVEDLNLFIPAFLEEYKEESRDTR